MDRCRKGMRCNTSACKRMKKINRRIFFTKLLIEFFSGGFFKLLLFFSLKIFNYVHILQAEEIRGRPNDQRIKITAFIINDVINGSYYAWRKTVSVLTGYHSIAS